MRTTMLMMFVCALLALPSMAFAQSDFPVPETFRLKKKADFKLHEQDFLNCVNWLRTHPSDGSDEYTLVTRFANTWCQGTPYVTIILTGLVTEGLKDCPEMMFSFMNGWAKYVIETGDQDEMAAYMAGMNHALDMYEDPICEFPKSKYWNKILKARNDGKLEDMINEEYAE